MEAIWFNHLFKEFPAETGITKEALLQGVNSLSYYADTVYGRPTDYSCSAKCKIFILCYVVPQVIAVPIQYVVVI